MRLETDRRLELLERLADALSCVREGLIQGIVRSAGKTRRVAEGEVDLALRRLRAFRAEVAPLLAGRAPVGTVALVLPGNASLSNPVATIGTAFLAGNEVRARFPRSLHSWAAQLEPLLVSHLPGVSLDHGPGPEFLRSVCTAPEVGVVMVFGDDSWAQGYETQVRASGKKLIFEGPGKDPFLVLAGADLERAARAAVRGAYYNAGQACTSPERFYVQRDLVAEFTSRVVELTRREVLGDPEDENTTVGPILSERVSVRIAAHLEDAIARGAQVLAGGRLRSAALADGRNATYVEPTVLAGASSAMAVMREETFGPVIPIQEVSGAEEALALAGSSPYGLAANVFGGDGTAPARLAESHGQVFREEIWLDYVARHLHAPYGGRKRSGWVWEWTDGRFIQRDGARVNALELSRPATL